ncbi:MAG: hypothetical protein IT338_13835 [Thermomicrobiales bacterium]|nr:hypothetical protein [Thermomicrobiales bacterium]
MDDLDLIKQDMIVIYAGRTFGLRVYRQSGAWRGVIIENQTPIRGPIEPTADGATAFAAAVAFIAAHVDATAETEGSVA